MRLTKWFSSLIFLRFGHRKLAKGRHFSNSIYPGQTYKICVRTEQHAFHLETMEFTREDGTVSLDSYTYHIHERNDDYREIFDDALARQFLDIVWDYTKSFRR